MRIYVDTSVFGGYFDQEFAKWSRKLFVEFEGKKDSHKGCPYISTVP
jgi:hypothetical protein